MTNTTPGGRKVNAKKGHQGFHETEKAEATNASLASAQAHLANPECLDVREGSIVEWTDPEDGETLTASVYSITSSAHPMDMVKAPAGDDELLLYLTDGTEVAAFRDETHPIRERLQPGDVAGDPFNVGVPAMRASDLDRSVYQFTNAKTAIVKKGDGLSGPYDVTLIGKDKNGKDVFEDHKAETPEAVAALLRQQSIPDDNLREVFRRAVSMSAEQRVRLAALRDDLNEGAWGDLESNAHIAVRTRAFPMSDETGDAVEAIHEYTAPPSHNFKNRAAPSRTDYVAATAVREAAWALARRDLVGDPLVSDERSGWTQEAYDHVTRPYRVVFGPLHPDDEALPESWAKRPSPQPEFDSMFGVAREG